MKYRFYKQKLNIFINNTLDSGDQFANTDTDFFKNIKTYVKQIVLQFKIRVPKELLIICLINETIIL